MKHSQWQWTAFESVDKSDHIEIIEDSLFTKVQTEIVDFGETETEGKVEVESENTRTEESGETEVTIETNEDSLETEVHIERLGESEETDPRTPRTNLSSETFSTSRDLNANNLQKPK